MPGVLRSETRVNWFGGPQKLRAPNGIREPVRVVEPLLSVRRVMRQQFAVLHKMLLDMVRDDLVCRRLMTAPGVGAVVALTYRATVDQPQRFVHSRAVGAHVGLTPKRYQSGETDYDGGVSKCGDALLRTMLYEAAHSLLIHGRQWSWLKAWGIRVAQRRSVQPWGQEFADSLLERAGFEPSVPRRGRRRALTNPSATSNGRLQTIPGAHVKVGVGATAADRQPD